MFQFGNISRRLESRFKISGKIFVRTEKNVDESEDKSRVREMKNEIIAGLKLGLIGTAAEPLQNSNKDNLLDQEHSSVLTPTLEVLH